MKKFLGVCCSIVLAIFLFLFQFTFGLLVCARNVANPNNISSTVQKIDFRSIMYDEDGKLTEMGESVSDMFVEMGFNPSTVKELLNTPTLKKVIGDFVGSVVEASLDSNVEVKYPSKEEVKSIVNECYDIVSKEQKIDVTKEEAIKMVDEQYDDFISELKNVSEELSKVFDSDSIDNKVNVQNKTIINQGGSLYDNN